jgi:hypothetical protein
MHDVLCVSLTRLPHLLPQTDDAMDSGAEVRGAWCNVTRRAAKAAATSAASQGSNNNSNSNNNNDDAGAAVSRALLPYLLPQGTKATVKLAHALLKELAGLSPACVPVLLRVLAAVSKERLGAKERTAAKVSDAEVCGSVVSALAEAAVASATDCLVALTPPVRPSVLLS